MTKRDRGVACCGETETGRFRVESLISVDERGQMVLPKDIRDRADIRAGDKLALVSWERGGKVCCFSLIKAEDFAGMVKGMLGPLMKEMMAADAK